MNEIFPYHHCEFYDSRSVSDKDLPYLTDIREIPGTSWINTLIIYKF